jgi:ribulose 1,5-bisphosphate carboxylase large subunit-like protein
MKQVVQNVGVTNETGQWVEVRAESREIMPGIEGVWVSVRRMRGQKIVTDDDVTYSAKEWAAVTQAVQRVS